MNKQGFCPICSNSLTGCYDINPSFNDGELYFEWKCKNCNTNGEEHYTMEFDDHYNYNQIDEDEIN